jgi:predicted transposase YbfD/YdcC
MTALSVDPDDLADLYPGVRQIVRIVRTRQNTKTHALSQEIVYALTAADADRLPPAEAAQAIRDHWRIETILHRQKDVHMREDDDRTHLLHAPHNLGALRNLAILLLRQATAAAATWQRRRQTVTRQPWRIHRLLTCAAA